jgi:hypothetical protein
MPRRPISLGSLIGAADPRTLGGLCRLLVRERWVRGCSAAGGPPRSAATLQTGPCLESPGRGRLLVWVTCVDCPSATFGGGPSHGVARGEPPPLPPGRLSVFPLIGLDQPGKEADPIHDVSVSPHLVSSDRPSEWMRAVSPCSLPHFFPKNPAAFLFGQLKQWLA